MARAYAVSVLYLITTSTIPIVFTLVGDPVAAGVVRSLSRPESNLTGVSSPTTELVAVPTAPAGGRRAGWTLTAGGTGDKRRGSGGGGR